MIKLWQLTLLAASIACSGCATKHAGDQPKQIATHKLLETKLGTSRAEVEAHLKVKGEHEFSARIGTNEQFCVSILFQEPPASFYFLFNNDKLQAIVRPPPFEREKTPWERTKAVNPEERLAAVLGQPHLSREDISAILLERSQLQSGKKGSLAMLPALLIISPFLAANAGNYIANRSEYRKLREKYDPFKINPGMERTEVIRLWGDPARSLPFGTDQQIHIFGAPNPPNVPARSLPALSGVIFENEKVIRVFSHHFFREDWKQNPTPSVRPELLQAVALAIDGHYIPTVEPVALKELHRGQLKQVVIYDSFMLNHPRYVDRIHEVASCKVERTYLSHTGKAKRSEVITLSMEEFWKPLALLAACYEKFGVVPTTGRISVTSLELLLKQEPVRVRKNNREK
ncbi:MAG: hypothetical protein K0Q55_1611 [Verrucomicrobia bacterium]|jgi:hypothetical protein|nr:hypothetical protein [Verrucomicrobiota bacterium]